MAKLQSIPSSRIETVTRQDRSQQRARKRRSTSTFFLRDSVQIFRPNVTALGYGLFLAINAAGVWGGTFPFLPLDFQTPNIMLRFFLAQSLVFSACYFTSMVGVYYFPNPTRTFIVRLATLPYLFGWCCLIGAIYLDDYAQLLVTTSGALLGLGSAGFYMLWQRLFSSQTSDEGDRNLILGTLYGSVFYFMLHLIPRAVTAFLIPCVFLPLFGLAISLQSRAIDHDQAMFQDVPREHPNVYQHLVKDYWRSALCVGAMAFCAGLMRALAISEPAMGMLVNIMSMVGSFLVAAAMLVLWQLKSLNMNIEGLFRVFFPFAITAFLLLPFLPSVYEHWLAAILYALYSMAIILMMIQCAQASRERGINPVFIYGFFGSIVYVLHDVGFLGGAVNGAVSVMGITPLAIVALVAVYLLGITFFVAREGFGIDIEEQLDGHTPSIELIVIRRNEKTGYKQVEKTKDLDGGRATSADSQATAPHANLDKVAGDKGAAGTLGPAYQDRISKQIALVRQRYRLSTRETEVTELIVRGNTVSRIAEKLVVSENTIRTHTKRIYAKLDIHKKQELIDLIDSFDPRELKE